MAGADEAGQTPQATDPSRKETDRERPAVERAPEQARGTLGPTAEQTAEPTEISGDSAPEPQTPGFGERGRMRRRARFLRKARELAYRDLGGLVFDLHRFGQRNDPLVLAKLATLTQIDMELRELESVLRERRPVTVLREVGIAACPRCAAIHGSDDRFCPGCGLAFDANADRPISTAPVGAQSHTPTAPVNAQPVNAQPQTSATPASVQPQTSMTTPPATAYAPTAKPAHPAEPKPVPAAEPKPPPAAEPKPVPAAEPKPVPAAEPTPVPAAEPKPVSAADSKPPVPAIAVRGEPDPPGEDDEPTQVLRPPARET